MTEHRTGQGNQDDQGKNGKRNGPVLKWHRRLGFATALFLVLLSITGVALNHGSALNLDRRTTDNQWLLAWYGLNIKSDLISFRAGDQTITWSNNHLFLDGRAVVENTGRVGGAVRSKDLIAATSSDEILLLTPAGDLVERLTGASLPGSIIRVGVDQDNRTIVETNTGIFAAKTNFMGWSPTDAAPDWSTPFPTPASLRQKVLVAYRGEGLPWSRVLLDLHSGRLFGTWGPLVMDATAIILIILAITGLINWKRRK